ncbi:MAG: Sec-independent protein translocase protein TatB [Pseudomonadales bacterium]
MFDIGFAELLIIGVVALLVLGPERLPGAIRTTSGFLRQARSTFTQLKTEIEREVDTAEIKAELHNQSIMKQLKDEVGIDTSSLDEIKKDLNDLEYDLSSNKTDTTDKNSDKDA